MLFHTITLFLLSFTTFTTAIYISPAISAVSRFSNLITAAKALKDLKETLPPIISNPSDLKSLYYLSLSNVLRTSQSSSSSSPEDYAPPLSIIPIRLALPILKALRFEILQTPKIQAQISSILAKNDIQTNTYNVSLLEAYGVPGGLYAYEIRDVAYIKVTYLAHTNTIPIANISFVTQNTTAFVQFQPARVKFYFTNTGGSSSSSSTVVMPETVDVDSIKHDFHEAWMTARHVGGLDKFESVKLVGGGEAEGWKDQGYYLFRKDGKVVRIGSVDLCVDEECAVSGASKRKRNSMGDRRRRLKRKLRRVWMEKIGVYL